MRKKEIIEEIYKKVEKYFGLVWYARTEPEIIDVPGKGYKEAFYADAVVREKLRKVLKESSTEVANLSSKDGDWHHGFNSGMLAGMRYVISLHEDGVEIAEEEFPFLDT